jgi:hypothetical protein
MRPLLGVHVSWIPTPTRLGKPPVASGGFAGRVGFPIERSIPVHRFIETPRRLSSSASCLAPVN